MKREDGVSHTEEVGVHLDGIVKAQSRLDWGDKVITQNHPTQPPTYPSHHKLSTCQFCYYR